MKTLENQSTHDLGLFNKELLTPEVIERLRVWIAALESGDWRQGRRLLCLGDEYCCLGIANKVCNLGEHDEFGLIGTYRMIGLCSEGGDLRGRILDSLAALNDYAGEDQWSFLEIANLLRDQLKVLGVEI